MKSAGILLVALIGAVPLHAQNARDPRGDWGRVLKVRSGTPIILEIRNDPPVRREFVTADHSMLVTLNREHPALPVQAKRDLGALVREYADSVSLAFTPGGLRYKSVVVKQDGVFVDGALIAATGEIIERRPRTDVVEISNLAVRRGSRVLGAAGAVAGLAAGLRIAYGILLSDEPCGTCRDEKIMATAAVVGMPIAGGVLGYHAHRHTVRTVIYLRPPVDAGDAGIMRAYRPDHGQQQQRRDYRWSGAR